MSKNKQNVALEIFKTKCLLFLYDHTTWCSQQSQKLSHHQKIIQKVWEGFQWSVCLLYNINITIFPLYFYFKEEALDRWDNILVFLIFLESRWFFLNCSSLAYIILIFLLLLNYIIAVCESLITSFEATNQKREKQQQQQK